MTKTLNFERVVVFEKFFRKGAKNIQMGGGAVNHNGGSGGLYPFFCREYFKNYLKNEKIENTKNSNFFLNFPTKI